MHLHRRMYTNAYMNLLRVYVGIFISVPGSHKPRINLKNKREEVEKNMECGMECDKIPEKIF